MNLLLASITMCSLSLWPAPAALACDEPLTAAQASAAAWAAADGQGSSHVFSVTSAHAVEVRIENGKISVKLDGKEVPADRIRQIGEQIQIIGENGNAITSLNIIQGGQWAGAVPAAGAELFVQPQVQLGWQVQAQPPMDAAAPPKVMLGVHMGDPGPALEKHLKLEPGKTTMIVAVGKDLAADKAGLQPFDIIVSVDGNTPADQNTIRGFIADREPGDSMRLVVIQAGERKEIKVPLEAYDTDRLGSVEWRGEAPQAFNLQFGSNPEQWADLLVDPQHRIFQRFRTHVGEGMGIDIDLDDVTSAEDPGLDDRIDDLNDRMAQLEDLIRQLIEQRQQ